MSRMMAFIDGENLVARYEALIRDRQWTPRGTIGHRTHWWTVEHVERQFVWAPLTLINVASREQLLRAHYYTTYSGDDMGLQHLAKTINGCNAVTLRQHVFMAGETNAFVNDMVDLVPRVYKKEGRSSKTKSVDINLCVDVMDYVRQDAVDAIYLVSGDGDYLPLIRAVMGAGKRVYLGALSSGLAQQLKYVADEFHMLDGIYFDDVSTL